MTPMITREMVAKKIAAWLQHELTLETLVDWAETALMNEDFADDETSQLAKVVARLATADVRNFGLSWDDCEKLLKQLGYVAHVEITAA
jgi:glycine/D-amino acid oxidase-like deaminating enzyme